MRQRMYRLLHVEADPTAQRAIVQALAQSPLPFALDQVADAAALAPPFDGTGVDALLLGTRDRASSRATLARCRQWFSSQPIILLADTVDLAFARDALQAGAQDVVQPGERALAVLPRILLYAIERAGAEARGKLLQAEARGLRAALDALLENVLDPILQADPTGALQGATPSAAALIGLDLPLAPGAHLAERVEPADRGRLQAFLTADAARRDAAASFAFRGPDGSRLLELQPLGVANEPRADAKLFRVAELAADFMAEADAVTAVSRRSSPPATATANGRCTHPDQELSYVARPSRPAAPIAHSQPAAEPAAGAAVEHTAVAGAAASPLAQLRELAEVATWHASSTTGSPEACGFLRPDEASAPVLQRLAAAARDDVDLGLAVDALQVRGWREVAAGAGEALPDRLMLEVSYGTVASRPHFERLLAEIAASSAGLPERFLLLLQGVPKGIYVPTLAKAIRAMGSSHGKPALQLPDLDTDYRSLVLGHLSSMSMAVEDLKRALSRDAKQVAAFLARARNEGCRTIVRGAAGPLAEALRSRLGIDMTVAA
jgi:PAS domain-containing protein